MLKRCSAALVSEPELELESEFQRQDACSALTRQGTDVGVGVPESAGGRREAVGGRSHSAGGEVETTIDACELHVIQHIESFQPELEFPALPEADTSADR